MTFAEAWGYGGWLMWVLLAMSIAGLACCVYFILTLRADNVAPLRLRRDLPKYLMGDDPEEARRLCEDAPSPLAAVMLATLDAIRNAPHAGAPLIAQVAGSEGRRQAELIEGRTQWLLDIATIAPMVGLLGTVIGMLGPSGPWRATLPPPSRRCWPRAWPRLSSPLFSASSLPSRRWRSMRISAAGRGAWSAIWRGSVRSWSPF